MIQSTGLLNANARLIGGLPKLSHIPVSTFMRETLHWLPVPKRIQFKILAFIRHSLIGSARSLPNSRSTLPSAGLGLLFVPFMRSATAQFRNFAYVCPSSWNHLRQQLRLELLTLPLPLSWKRLKTILFVSDSIDLLRERLWISE